MVEKMSISKESMKMLEDVVKDSLSDEECEYLPTGNIGFDLALSDGKGIPIGASALFWADPGCVDKDTEFFTGHGWKKISEWNGEQVLQYNEDGTASLVTPLDYINHECKEMYHIKTKYGVDQMLSDKHNMVYFNNTANPTLHMKLVCDVIDEHEKSKGGFRGLIKSTFNYIDGTGIDLSDIEIKIMLAVMADGHLDGSKCVIRLKKERKIIELEKILNEGNVEYSKTFSAGYTVYRFTPPIYTKEVPEEWYNMSQRQLKIVRENVDKWDGCYGTRGVFFSTNKNNADFVQFAFVSSNVNASISKDVREERSTCYGVNISNISYKSFGHTVNEKREIKKVPTEDGKMYCFTVPSGMLVLRRNDNVFITGNCGKTTLLADVCRRLLTKAKNNNEPFKILYLDTEGSWSLLKAIGLGEFRKSGDLIYVDKQLCWRNVEMFYEAVLQGRPSNYKDVKLIILDSNTNVLSDQNMQKSVADGDFGTKAKERGNFYCKYLMRCAEKGITSFFISQARQKQDAGMYEDDKKAAVSRADLHNVEIIIKCGKKSSKTDAAKVKTKTIFGEVNEEQRYILTLNSSSTGCKNRHFKGTPSEVLMEKGKGTDNTYVIRKMLEANGYLKSSGGWLTPNATLCEITGLSSDKKRAKEINESIRNNIGQIIDTLKENNHYKLEVSSEVVEYDEDDSEDEGE